MNVSSAEMGGLDVICSAAVRELEGSPVLDLARVLCCKEGGEWESECWGEHVTVEPIHHVPDASALLLNEPGVRDHWLRL